jgi:hypothetical protein
MTAKGGGKCLATSQYRYDGELWRMTCDLSSSNVLQRHALLRRLTLGAKKKKKKKTTTADAEANAFTAMAGRR